MAKFIGRREELRTLKRLLVKPYASLMVIKGRRRIGKSRLLEEFAKDFEQAYFFAGLAPSPVTTDQDQKLEFSKQFHRQIGKAPSSEGDWSDLFWELSQHSQDQRILIVLDEISWMGSKDANFLGKLKNAWDLYFKKNDRLVLAICGSSSLWIEQNILSSTGFLGRESLVLTLEEMPLSDCVKFWGESGARISAMEKLKVLSVTGGIPRYLESIDPLLSAEQNIQNLCFQPSGILLNEFEKIFSDLFSPRQEFYKQIVIQLADGMKDQTSILDGLHLQKGGDTSSHLNALMTSGFISRDFTWKIQDGKVSNLSHYRLKDNYSRFYLKYILPNRSRILLGDMDEFSLVHLPGWPSIMGLQLENLVLSNRRLIKQALGISPQDIICDNPFFQKKTSKQTGCQIDYLIQVKHNILYICEIKFSNREVNASVIEEAEKKIAALKIPKRFSYRTVLIHVNGVSEALEDSQYFSHMIDFGRFLDAPPS